jgi:hypothetical protein
LSSADVSEKVTAGLDAAVANGEMTEQEAAEIRALLQGKLNDPGQSDSDSVQKNESEGGEVMEDDDPGLQIRLDRDDDRISFNDKPWDRETNPFILPGAPDFINNWINNEIEESPQKGREIEANPDIIIDKIFDVLPIAVFIMLPLVALLLKFWYLFSGHYYVEHLIHALHNHSFLFVIFILMIVTDSIAKWADPGGEALITKTAQLTDFILFIWIPFYLLFSLKKVYQQGWAMTLGKYALLGVSYIVLLTAVTSAAALAGFVLL